MAHAYLGKCFKTKNYAVSGLNVKMFIELESFNCAVKLTRSNLKFDVVKKRKLKRNELSHFG